MHPVTPEGKWCSVLRYWDTWRYAAPVIGKPCRSPLRVLKDVLVQTNPPAELQSATRYFCSGCRCSTRYTSVSDTCPDCWATRNSQSNGMSNSLNTLSRGAIESTKTSHVTSVDTWIHKHHSATRKLSRCVFYYVFIWSTKCTLSKMQS